MRNNKKVFFPGLFLVMLSFFGIAKAAPELSVGTASGAPGAQVSIPVNFTSDGSVVAIQFDIQYDPTQLSAADPVPSSSIAGVYSAYSSEPSAGLRRILIVPPETNPVIPSGALVDIPFTINPAANDQSNVLVVDNASVVLSDSNAAVVLSSAVVSGEVISVGANPPVITITAPVDGYTNAALAAFVFRGTASDVEDGDLNSDIHWSSSLDGDLGDGATVGTVGELSAGTHIITASVTDSSGLSGTDIITVTVLDTVRGVSLTVDPPSSKPLGTTITFTAQGEGGDPATYTYAFWHIGPGVFNIQANQSSNQYAFTPSDPSLAGRHTIYVWIGVAGGENEITHDKIRYTVTTPNAAPEVNISLPANRSFYTLGDNISFTATASDAEEGDLSAQIAWSSDLGDNLPDNIETFTTDQLQTGIHTITASVTDSAGNTSSDNIIITVSDWVTGVSLTQSLPSPQPAGTAITFTAQGQGLADPLGYEYMFYHGGPETNGMWEEVPPGYSGNASFILQTGDPDSVGRHNIIVLGRAVGSTAYYEVWDWIRFTVSSP